MAAVLTSWKEIASYLGKGVRTVQRWEREMDLPVRRPKPKEKQIVLAFPDELDDWVRQQPPHPRTENRPNRAEYNGHIETLVEESMRLHPWRQPMRTSNMEGFRRMHLLLEQMMQQARVIHERTEDLFRSVRQCQKINGKTNQVPPSAG